MFSETSIKPQSAVLAIALLRVSSDRQYQEGHGIEEQQKRVDFYASQNNIRIVRYFIEHYSGRKTDRQVWLEIIEYIKAQNGAIKQLVIKDIERFTRAGAGFYERLKNELNRLDVELVDVYGVIQKPVNTMEHLGVEYEWSVRSPSHTTEVIMADQANANATQILTRCIGGQIEVGREGYQINEPIFGYRNERYFNDTKKVSIMVPYEEEARFIKPLFDMRAEGIMSDKQICARINAMGFKTRLKNKYHSITRHVIGQIGGKPLSVKQLNRFISNPTYCGLRRLKWTNYELQPLPYDQALVSIDLFNRANRGKVYIEDCGFKYRFITNRKAYSNVKDTPEFMLRHVISCPICKHSFVGSKSRGKSGKRFGYYHCSRGHEYLGINQKEFENTVASYIKKITIKKKYLGLLKEVARDVWIQKNQQHFGEKKAIGSHVDGLRVRQKTLLNRIETTESHLVRQRLEDEFDAIETQITQAKNEEEQITLKEQQINDYFAFLKMMMEHPEKYLLKSRSKDILIKVWHLTFDKPPTYEEIKNGTPQLSLVFKLNRDSNLSKRQLVHLLSQQWNTFEAHVLKVLGLDLDNSSEVEK